MTNVYYIYQKTLFSRRYFIKDSSGKDVVEIKFKTPFAGSGALAKFNGRQWEFKFNFLNTKAEFISQQPGQEIKFETPKNLLNWVSRSTELNINGQDYVFERVLLSRLWYKYKWTDSTGNEVMELAKRRFTPRQAGEVHLLSDIPEELACSLMAIGLYLSKATRGYGS